MEFHALQSFSLARSRSASRRPAALLPFTTTAVHPATTGADRQLPEPWRGRDGQLARMAATPTRLREKLRDRVRLQGLAPRDESVAAPRRLGRKRARCSPGLAPSSGDSPSLRRRDVAASASSHELEVNATGAEAPALTHTLLPGVCPERGWSSSRRSPTDPHEVCLPRRSPPVFGIGPVLAHGFASGPAHVTVNAASLFGQ